MSPRLGFATLGVAGILLALAIGLGAHAVSSDSVGLSDEPLRSVDSIAPERAERSPPAARRERRARARRAAARRRARARARARLDPVRTAPEASVAPQPVGPPTTTSGGPRSGDDSGGRGRGRGRGRSGGSDGSDDSGGSGGSGGDD